MTFLFDVAPSSAGMVGIAAAAVFFLVAAAAAFVAFKLLKKSMKMAFRVAILLIILVIAVAGSIALWSIESAPSGRPVPRNRR
jgi:hypothetical protein